MGENSISPAQTDALAKLAEIPGDAEGLTGQGEPVAWAYEYFGVSQEWIFALEKRRPPEDEFHRNIRPLYAALAVGGASSENITETIAAFLWVDAFGSEARIRWDLAVEQAEERGSGSAAAEQVERVRRRAQRIFDAIRAGQRPMTEARERGSAGEGLDRNALAKLAEIPPAGSEEREQWLQMAERHGFYGPRLSSTYAFESDAALFLMSEARKQGQRDVLGAGADQLHAAIDGIDPHEEAENYDYRIDGEYRITDFERGMLEDFATELLGKVSAALRTLETGGARHG